MQPSARSKSRGNPRCNVERGANYTPREHCMYQVIKFESGTCSRVGILHYQPTPTRFQCIW